MFSLMAGLIAGFLKEIWFYSIMDMLPSFVQRKLIWDKAINDTGPGENETLRFFHHFTESPDDNACQSLGKLHRSSCRCIHWFSSRSLTYRPFCLITLLGLRFGDGAIYERHLSSFRHRIPRYWLTKSHCIGSKKLNSCIFCKEREGLISRQCVAEAQKSL